MGQCHLCWSHPPQDLSKGVWLGSLSPPQSTPLSEEPRLIQADAFFFFLGRFSMVLHRFRGDLPRGGKKEVEAALLGCSEFGFNFAGAG